MRAPVVFMLLLSLSGCGGVREVPLAEELSKKGRRIYANGLNANDVWLYARRFEGNLERAEDAKTLHFDGSRLRTPREADAAVGFPVRPGELLAVHEGLTLIRKDGSTQNQEALFKEDPAEPLSLRSLALHQGEAYALRNPPQGQRLMKIKGTQQELLALPEQPLADLLSTNGKWILGRTTGDVFVFFDGAAWSNTGIIGIAVSAMTGSEAWAVTNPRITAGDAKLTISHSSGGEWLPETVTISDRDWTPVALFPTGGGELSFLARTFVNDELPRWVTRRYRVNLGLDQLDRGLFEPTADCAKGPCDKSTFAGVTDDGATVWANFSDQGALENVFVRAGFL